MYEKMRGYDSADRLDSLVGEGANAIWKSASQDGDDGVTMMDGRADFSDKLSEDSSRE